jgi:hypothetical protein
VITTLFVRAKTHQSSSQTNQVIRPSSTAEIPSALNTACTGTKYHTTRLKAWSSPGARKGPTINTNCEFYGLVAVVLIKHCRLLKYHLSGSFFSAVHQHRHCLTSKTTCTLITRKTHSKMSFFGMGRPQPSSAEKIAAVEQEMKLMASMHNR